jgi:CheY-like chemotaxis protein
MATDPPRRLDEARLAEIVDVVIAIASNDFARRAPIGDGHDPLDGLATSVNRLAEEIGNQHARERTYRQQFTQTERLAGIGQLATRVAHDVNQPASFILLNLAAMDALLSKLETTASSEQKVLLEQARSITADNISGVERIVAIARGLRTDGPPGSTATAPPQPASARKARVLFVDDEDQLLSAFRRLFAPEYDVTTALGGQAALAILERDGDWDAVVCDLMMSDLDGAGVFDWMRTHRPALTERLLLCTGGAFTARGFAFADLMKTRLLQKPVPPKQMRDAIERVRPRD